VGKKEEIREVDAAKYLPPRDCAFLAVVKTEMSSVGQFYRVYTGQLRDGKLCGPMKLVGEDIANYVFADLSIAAKNLLAEMV
jgi:hypothetical protein